MHDELFARVRRVFAIAAKLPPAERAAALNELCAGEDDLRSEVASLLEHESADPFDRPLSEQLTLSRENGPEVDLVGTTIGAFRVVARIAHGGMGSVWEARQERPQRRVAIKVLRRALAGRDDLWRFDQEAELLARLHHAGVAHVYEAGTFECAGDRLPYFAMELVHGARTLDVWAKEPQADLRTQIEIMSQVCEAIAHGHRRGVIHRDLKPGNILIDEEGRPKVIDFGVARVVGAEASSSNRTRIGEVLGTPAYMSPEQWSRDRRDVDSQSDVYALGVVLYELTTGRLPYELPANLLHAATHIHSVDVPSPAQFAGALRGELEAVILKALERDRERRYTTADDLAADLRRWLHGEPVLARAPGRWRRSANWIGRHPLRATGLGLASLLTASSLIGWLLYRLAIGEPSRIECNADGNVVLRARGGFELHSWGTSRADLVVGELVERSPSLGGGKFVVLGFDLKAPNKSWAGQLCFFDTDDLDTPAWKSGQAPMHPPNGEPDFQRCRFLVDLPRVIDVFLDRPGPEIVAVYSLSPFSPSCLRVHDLSGEVLYEAWHDGGILDVSWLPDARILVVCALDSEWRWDQRGIQDAHPTACYPVVLFALRLENGRVHVDNYLHRDGAVRDPTVAWYRWFGPAALAVRLPQANLAFEALSGDVSPDRIQVSFGPYSGFESAPRIHVTLNARGFEIARYSDDAWKRLADRASLPRAEEFNWLDAPELPPPTAVEHVDSWRLESTSK